MRNFSKILITGIHGSGGSFLAEHLLKKEIKAEICGIYNNTNSKFFYKKLKTFKCDLTNYSKTYSTIKKIKPDLIFHLASIADVNKSFYEPYKILKNNCDLTLNLLETESDGVSDISRSLISE